MSLNPATFEEAKSRFKPLKRSRLATTSPKPQKSLLSPRKRSKPLSRKPVKKAKRKKKLSIGNLKKKVWTQFSIFIRTRDADGLGWSQCFTCPQKSFWREMQAGHFIRGRLNANLFDERGCQVQCYSCNIHRQGNVVIYYRMMLLKYGDEVISALLLQNSTTRKWQGGELQGLLDHYKAINAANPLLQKESQ
jgi:hypothetical protein